MMPSLQLTDLNPDKSTVSRLPTLTTYLLPASLVEAKNTVNWIDDYEDSTSLWQYTSLEIWTDINRGTTGTSSSSEQLSQQFWLVL